jgi:hypothetical protein
MFATAFAENSPLGALFAPGFDRMGPEYQSSSRLVACKLVMLKKMKTRETGRAGVNLGLFGWKIPRADKRC